jgi:hypothetical protein
MQYVYCLYKLTEGKYLTIEPSLDGKIVVPEISQPFRNLLNIFLNNR